MPRSRAPCRSRLRHSSTAPFPGELFGTKSRQERPGKPYSLHPPSLFTLLFHSPFHTRQGTKYGFATRSFDDCGPACAPALLTEQRVRAWAWGLQRGVPRSREGQEGRPQRGRGWHRGTCSGTRAPRGGRRSHCVQGPCKPTPVLHLSSGWDTKPTQCFQTAPGFPRLAVKLLHCGQVRHHTADGRMPVCKGNLCTRVSVPACPKAPCLCPAERVTDWPAPG